MPRLRDTVLDRVSYVSFILTFDTVIMILIVCYQQRG